MSELWIVRGHVSPIPIRKPDKKMPVPEGFTKKGRLNLHLRRMKAGETVSLYFITSTFGMTESWATQCMDEAVANKRFSRHPLYPMQRKWTRTR